MITFDYNNPADKLSENYQGYESITDINSMSAVQLTSESTILSWAEVIGATKYHLIVGNDSSFSIVYYENDGLNTNSIATNTLGLKEGDNFYKVRAFREIWGEWSSTLSFTTEDLVEPSNGSPSSDTVLTGTTPTLSWDEVTGATGYELQINTAGDFTGTEIVSDDTLTTNSYALITVLDNNSSYYWRVKQKDVNGVWSDWSNVFTFSVGLEVPSNGSPSSDTVLTNTTPTLSWDEVTGATGFWLQINAAGDFTGTEIVSDDTLTTNSYTLPTALDNNSNYYWRVKQKDVNGVWSDWSSVYRLKYIIIYSEYILGMSFVTVLESGGSATFYMGSTSGDSDESPVHGVTLTQGYQMSTTEITQKQYEDIMYDESWSFYGTGDNYPAYNVSWYEAAEFCNKLSIKDGLTPAYYSDSSYTSQYMASDGNSIYWKQNGTGYRLPTEAEWEYAARGGAESNGYTYSGSNTLDDVAWFSSNSGRMSHEVGTKQANELGLYDMSGNLWEWCWDWYDSDYYSSSPSEDPGGASSGSDRVTRGGYWLNSTNNCRVANRSDFSPGNSGLIGIRVVSHSSF